MSGFPEVTVLRRSALRSPSRDDSGLSKVIVILGVVGAVTLGGTSAALLSGNSTSLGGVLRDTPAEAAPTPVLTIASLTGENVQWKRPLTLVAAQGTLSEVTVTGGDGQPYAGTLTPERWTGHSSLVPTQSYTLHAVLTSADGKATSVDKTVKALGATSVLHAHAARPGSLVGVGQPVIVKFDQAVKGAAARAAVLQRLTVTTTPTVVGAWRWYNSFEAHYRGEKYWASGTKVDVSANLSGLRLPGTDTWGGPAVDTGGFTVGKNYQSVVDITAHTMTVKLDGKVIRVLKVSTGRDKYPTKGGVHIVLTREKSHTYNSATVGIPTSSPDGYYEKLPWSMRISNGGAFVHANPATTRVQGISNVSHGCVNASLVDAEWYYYHSQVGDVVDIIHAVVKPVKYDAGMADWNYTWDEWKSGNLTA